MVYHEPQFTEIRDLNCHDAQRRSVALDTAIGDLDFGETPDMSGIEIGPHFNISCSDDQKAAILACAAEIPLMLERTGWETTIGKNIYYTSLLGQQVNIWPKREGVAIEDPVQLSPNSWRVIWSEKVGKHVDITTYGLVGSGGKSEREVRKNAKRVYGPRILDNPLLRENVQDAMFVPYHANEPQALAFIRKQAARMAQELGHDEDLLYYSLVYTLRKNLEALDHSRVIRFSPNTLTRDELRGKEIPPEERVLFSPHEVRNTFRAVQKELVGGGDINTVEEASIEFLRRLNAMPEGEGYTDIRREIKSAHGFLKSVIATADEVTRKYFVPQMGPGTEVRKRKKLDIKNALRNKSLFELMAMMYDDNVRAQYDSRTLSEAETIMGIFSLFWRTHYHELKKNHEVVENDLNAALEEMSDSTASLVEVAIPELIYDASRQRFYKEHDMDLECSPVQDKYLEGLEIDGDPRETNMVPMVYIDEAEGKSEEAITNKLSGKSPEARLEDVTDIKRARVVVANWTSIEVSHDEKKQEILIRILKDIAKKVGLGEAQTEMGHLSPLNLKYRKQTMQDGTLKSTPESRIELQLDENFPKVKLIGFNEDGVCVEVQVIFSDTYAFDHAKNSPIAHDTLERDRRLVQIKKQLAESEYGAELHTAVGLELETSKEARKQANVARLRYLAQMSIARGTSPGQSAS